MEVLQTYVRSTIKYIPIGLNMISLASLDTPAADRDTTLKHIHSHVLHSSLKSHG
jgi:hypothetical protein